MRSAESRPLGPVSPSLLERLACPLRVAFTQRRSESQRLQRQTVTALLGNIAHDAIEAALRGADIDDAWSAAAESRKTVDIPFPETLPAARRTRIRIRKRLPALMRLLANLGPSIELLTEQELQTADETLRGRPDLIACGSETVIVDYKSGLVEHDSEIRESYLRQLLFYGGLVHECLGLIPKHLLLFSLRQGIITVPADPDVLRETATRARSIRNDYNDRTPGPQPAHPSPTTCRFCPHTPVCDPFWEAVDETWRPEVGLVVRGRLQTHPEHSAWGQSAMRIKVDSGPLSGRVVDISGIASDLVASASAGDHIAMTDLKSHTDDPSILRCSPDLASQRVAIF